MNDMNKRKVLVFHQGDRRLRNSFELVGYGCWTFSDYAAHYLSEYVFEDEDGNTVDESRHVLFTKEEENCDCGSFAFDSYNDRYDFVPLEKLSESGYEKCQECFWEGIRNGNIYSEEAYKDMRRSGQGEEYSGFSD